MSENHTERDYQSVPVIKMQLGRLEKIILGHMVGFEADHDIRIKRIKLSRKEGILEVKVVIEL